MKWKATLTVLLVGFLSGFAKCQTLEEWTNQKQLQTDYKVDQIIALKAYSDLAKKGYEIAGFGWNTVRNIQDGEFSLHREYFGSLTRVHPVVSGYPVAESIVWIYQQINREVGWMQIFLDSNNWLRDSELASVNRLNKTTLRNSDQILTELEAILTSNLYEMKDGERLAAVNGLESAMYRLFTGMRDYHDRVRFLEQRRLIEGYQKHQLKGLYEIR